MMKSKESVIEGHVGRMGQMRNKCAYRILRKPSQEDTVWKLETAKDRIRMYYKIIRLGSVYWIHLA
jgi:hypothetical protein